MEYQFISQQSSEYLEERELRARLLRLPLGMPRGSERFRFEDRCRHLVALEMDRVVGCLMFHPEAHEAGRVTDSRVFCPKARMGGRLLQMVVEEAFQGQGVGTGLVRFLEAHLAREGFESLYLHARDHALGFYEKLGYRAEGVAFTEVGISHHRMVKRLAGVASP